MADRTLWQWFTGSVERHPDAWAVETGTAALTYRALHRSALATAGRIVRERGAAPARVALLASRSMVAFAGYLAALRLGAAVVPLNPDYPAPRNRMICELAAVDLLLADEQGAAAVAGLAGAAPRTLVLTDAEVLGAADAAGLPAREACIEDVAYVLFTSGSTGRPKGVPIRHRNASPYVAHNVARHGIGPGCRTSHTFDLTFDPSVFDLFVTWAGGATLVVPRRAELLTPVDYLAEREITHWFSVPSVVSVSAGLGNLAEGRVTRLRQSIFIGEQLTYRQARQWRAVAPDARIDNVYGPTELTVACTEYRLPPDPGDWPATSNDTVPIGPVYGFLEHVVLDEDGRRAGEGELSVRGSQRFDGYLDPGDDRGRFLALDGGAVVVHDGTAALTGDHYYRTGDRVRFESGHLVHLGRLDNQVKVRGYRVELGEIEAAMRQHPDVTHAVVLATGRAPDVELTGYYTGREQAANDLVRWLRRRIPIHMVPRRFHHLDSMPLNANGKVDRGRLGDREATTWTSAFSTSRTTAGS
jgi:amino acid adenylation domain-containing protein